MGRILVIFFVTVIVIIGVNSFVSLCNIGKESERFEINLINTLTAFGKGDQMVRTDEEDYIGKRDLHKMVACRKNGLFYCAVCRETHLFHGFRQINITAVSILLVNGSDHHAVSKKKLVFYRFGVSVVRIIKSERTEHHFIV